jgi:hypothetical protein
MRKQWLIGGVAGLVALASLAVIGVQGTPNDSSASSAQDTTKVFSATSNPASYPTGQPIAFSHSIHAGTYHIDCQYCHVSAERSVDAGIPSVSSCMGCHQVIPGTAHPAEINKLEEYWKEKKPIPWVRIYKIPDHTHFPHMRHIHAGLTCQQCHGQVQDTYVINKPDPVWGGHNMGWCVSCHRKMGASTDCSRCHY